MKTTDAERLRKIQALYDGATSPGEKAAAFEALSRIREQANRGKDELFKAMKEYGFWKYMMVENKTCYVRRLNEEYIDIVENSHGINWLYNFPSVRKRGEGFDALLIELDNRMKK